MQVPHQGSLHVESPSAGSNHDLRLGAAFDAIDGGQIELLSVDVFDTVVFRRVPEPKDVFLLLGDRLRRVGGLPDSETPQVFAHFREAAEVRARELAWARRRAVEIKLSDIYEAFPRPLRGGFDRLTLEAAEVEVERSLLVADASLAGLLAAASERGIQTCLVSDTYFSDFQVQELLRGRGLRLPRLRHIFTSSRYLRGKNEGLFEDMLRQMKVDPARVLHVGDHPQSDVAAPLRHGMRALHYPKRDVDFEAVVEREGRVRCGTAPTRLSQVDLEHGDFGLTALRAKCSFLRAPVESDAPYFRYGASVMGPPLACFADWIVERCRRMGEGTVFCLMREGQFLADLIRRSAAASESPLEARTLWVSRQLCVRSSLLSASRAELKTVVARRGATLRQTCDLLGIDLASLDSLAGEGSAMPIDRPDLQAAFLDMIDARPDLRKMIVRHSSAVRARFGRYLRSQIGDRKRVVLCDLGWGGTIQRHLVDVLRREGFDVEVKGLYLITQAAVRDLYVRGIDTEGYLASAGFPENEVRWILRSPEILEQVCMPDLGSLLDFDDEAQPVLDAHPMGAGQIAQIQAVQEGARAFAGRWVTDRPSADSCLSPGLREQLLRMVFRSVVRPTRTEVFLLGRWHHDEGFGSTGTEPLLTDEALSLAATTAADEFLQIPMTRLYWPFGAAVAHSDEFGDAVSSAAEGRSGSMMGRGHSTRFDLFVDSGQGFRESEKGEAQIEEGYGQVARRTLVCKAAGPRVRAIRLDPMSRPGVFRMHGLRLELWSKGRSAPFVLELPDIDSLLRRFRTKDVVALGGPLLLARTADPQLIWQPGARGEGVERVVVEALIGIVPLQVDELEQMRPLRLTRAGKAWRAAKEWKERL